MFEVSVKSQDGKDVGKLTMPRNRLGGCVRYQLIKDVVVAYEAHRRVGTASVKTRAMVAGSTRKIYRQKGTGRARHGSKKANLFRGGGVVHGPVPRDYGGRLSKKARRVAARSALLSKFRDQEVRIVDRLSFEAPKTAAMEEVLANIGVGDETVLLVLPNGEDQHTVRNVYLSARNLPGVDVCRAQDVNARDILRSRVVLFSRDSLAALTERIGTQDQDGGAE